jgi:glycosyltransferase involved in cell wall biosynthesis
MPRVSVIIPAYNAAELLPETLDSVVAQTYGDWEAIVADDASSDDTAKVVEGRDPRISCVRSSRNLGIGGARNLALTRAQGELVALLDADDMWLPSYLERQVARYDAAVARGERVGIVCCDAYELGPEGRRARTYSHRAGWVDEVTLSTLLHRNTIFVSAMVPRVVVEELGGFATDCLGTEDYDLWLRILETGRRVVAARDPLVVYRVSDAAISEDVATMSRATQTTYRHALARGRLTRAQRRIARRELRLQRFVECWELIAAQTATKHRVPVWPTMRASPLGLRVVLEQPGRWAHWLRIAIAIARGAPIGGVDRTRTAV